MIICSSNNIDFIQGVVSYGNEPLITDWRIANSNGIFNIFNSKSNLGNLSILENGNISIGTSVQSGYLNVYGDVDITGVYKNNSRNVINDTSNYVLTTSNISISNIRSEVRWGSNYSDRVGIWGSNYSDMVGVWSSNYIGRLSLGGGGSSQWINSAVNANDIYYNTGKVGIGSNNPLTKLHIFDNTINETKLTIQNSYSSPDPEPITSTLSPTLGTTGIYKYIIFSYTTDNTGTGQTQYTINSQTGGVVCDVLLVGGGGGGGGGIGGGGGGGAVLYGANINVPSGSYNIKVGKGGGAGVNGSPTEAFGATCLGGGAAKNKAWDSSGTNNGNTGGSGGGGKSFNQVGPAGAGGTVGTSTKGTLLAAATLYNGNVGGAGQSQGGGLITSGGGGGASQAGANGKSGSNPSGTGKGGDGVAVNITGTTYYWGAGGGAGSFLTPAGNGGLGGGGAGIGVASTSGVVGGSALNTASGMTAASGSGSGGGGGNFDDPPTAGSGGSGIIIIRYMGTLTTSSIEFIRGVSSDSNVDYKIGNYAGDFKIFSSSSNIDTEYIRITSTGAISNPSGTTSWTTTSDRRIKENIEKASYDICYENINNLELNRFNYVEGFNNVNKDIRQLGFIAQEVKDIFPKAVLSYSYNNNNFNIPDLLSIDITQINYSLYGAVKKLMKMNDDKDRRIKRLETLLNIEDAPIDTSNIAIDTSNLSIDTSNIALDTSNLSIDTSNITIDTSNIAIDTSNISIDTSNITIDTSNIALDTSNISIDTSNISIDTSNIALDTSNIALDSSNIALDTSNIALDIL